MDPGEYRELKEVFLRVRELPTAERGEALDRECGGDVERRRQVEELLAADADDVLDAAARCGPLADAASSRIPERVGGYRVLGVLGEGGMGVVYRARQERPERTVALKVIRPGWLSSSLLRRFEHEAEVLGRLQHPGIAQIYEAGTADDGAGPQPYFAMELVEGTSILEHANAAGLGLRERIALLAKVCDAVEHAHQKGVVHRDLKPGNILVDRSGQPKVLDFGVARATDSDVRSATLQTSPGQLVGTLAYMSPEQASGDPSRTDTRSDVYALGVVCYELLSGRSPHDLRGKTLADAVRIIVEDDATPLGAVDRSLRGDLDTIVSKALSKGIDHRYAYAAAFAADLRRFLRDEPVLARPVSATYQLRKFARRNRGLVVGAVAALAFLVAGLVSSTMLAIRANERATEAEKQRRRANDEAAGAQEVTDFMVDLFAVSEPSRALGETILARELLDRGAETIEVELSGRPFSRSRVMTAIGRAYAQLGLFEEATSHLEGAVEILRTNEDTDPLDLARAFYVLGDCYGKRERFDDAVAAQNESLRLRLDVLPPDHPDVVRSRMALGVTYASSARHAEAEAELTEAARHAERVLAKDDVHRAQVFNELGGLYQQMGRFESAARNLEKALALWRDSLPPNHPKLAQAHNSLGMLFQAMTEYERSESHYAETLRILEEILPPGHLNLALLNGNLALQWADRDRFDRAEPYVERMIEVIETGGHEGHRIAAIPYAIRARAATARGDHRAAIENNERAIEIVEVAAGPDHADLVTLLRALSVAHRQSGRPERALPPLTRALEITETTYGKDHLNMAIALQNLGNLRRDLGDHEGAAAAHARSLEIQDAQETKSPFLATTLRTYARALTDLGRDEEAAAVAARLEAELAAGADDD